MMLLHSPTIRPDCHSFARQRFSSNLRDMGLGGWIPAISGLEVVLHSIDKFLWPPFNELCHCVATASPFLNVTSPRTAEQQSARVRKWLVWPVAWSLFAVFTCCSRKPSISPCDQSSCFASTKIGAGCLLCTSSPFEKDPNFHVRLARL